MPRIKPAFCPIRIQQRATFDFTIKIRAGGAPMILTGYNGIAQIYSDQRRSAKIADMLVSFINRLDGEIRLSLTRTQTRTLVKSGFWDLLLVDPNQNADYFLRGPAILEIGLSDDI